MNTPLWIGSGADSQRIIAVCSEKICMKVLQSRANTHFSEVLLPPIRPWDLYMRGMARRRRGWIKKTVDKRLITGYNTASCSQMGIPNLNLTVVKAMKNLLSSCDFAYHASFSHASLTLSLSSPSDYNTFVTVRLWKNLWKELLTESSTYFYMFFPSFRYSHRVCALSGGVSVLSAPSEIGKAWTILNYYMWIVVKWFIRYLKCFKVFKFLR